MSEGHPFLPGSRELSNKADRHVGVDLNIPGGTSWTSLRLP